MIKRAFNDVNGAWYNSYCCKLNLMVRFQMGYVICEKLDLGGLGSRYQLQVKKINKSNQLKVLSVKTNRVLN